MTDINSRFDKLIKPKERYIQRNTNKSTCRHITTKLMKTNHKEKILKASRENKTHLIKENNGRNYSSSPETMAISRQLNDIFKVLKEKIYQSTILGLVELFSKAKNIF